MYSHYLVVDKRITILDLKIKIAEYFKCSLVNLIFRRGGSHGMEIVEEDMTLKQA